QLGIGGWQPFSSSFVHEKKYGDCKALSFYTKSLLERYGIEGHYTLIRAGRGAANVSENFPNAHFNHAILTVPLEQDTVFLECTSQTNPYGYLGTFTSNRNALLITPEGGKLIRTKKYTVEDNVQKTKVVVDLSKEGDAKVSFTRTFTGIEIENYGFEHLYYKSEKEQSEWFVDNHEWGDMKLDHFSMESMQEGEVPEAGFQAAFIVNNEAKKMGSRLFLKPGKYVDSFVSKLSSDERKKPITIRYGYTQIDTIIYETPVYFHFEKGLDEVKMDTKYGYYQRSLNRSGEKIIYTRQFILKDGKYAPEEYEAFKNFINSVNKYDRQRVVVKGET
ncbi:MAG: hypothetical protein R3345_05510, partial [Fulvivirga sp.]|nr:hypothetical protein [Fulvivirga sp.]